MYKYIVEVEVRFSSEPIEVLISSNSLYKITYESIKKAMELSDKSEIRIIKITKLSEEEAYVCFLNEIEFKEI